jgi:hypothetical protein
MDNIGCDGELDLANVANGDCVGAPGSLDHSTEGAHLAIFDVHAQLGRCVVRSMPELDVGVKRAALGAKDDLNLLYRR